MGNCLNDHELHSGPEENRTTRNEHLVFGAEGVKELDLDPLAFAAKGVQWKDLSMPVSATVRELIEKFGLYNVKSVPGEEPSKVFKAVSRDYLYVGQMKDSKRHGRGYSLSSSGDLWVSAWVDNQAEGDGAVYFARGDYFQGKLSKGETASGRLTFPNGDHYTGDLCRTGCQHGRGEHFEAATRARFRGSWSLGLKDGPGELHQEEEWKNGVRIDNRRLEAPLQTLKPFPAEHQAKASASN